MNSNQPGNPLFQAAFEMQDYFQRQQWKFCFIGGLAVLRWGEIRLTQDIDLCLECGFGKEGSYIELLLQKFDTRISDAQAFAVENRVLLLAASNGVSVDIAFSGIDFEERMIERASVFDFESDCALITCSAEDLIVLKAFADRPRDWADIEGILIRQKGKLDRSAILNELTPLCRAKDSFKSIDQLAELFRTL